jgi:hypothetical protein
VEEILNMKRDTYSVEQRVRAAIALEGTDRAVFGASIDSFAASYAGITQEEWWFDHDKAVQALLHTYEELGPWDIAIGGAPGHPLAFALTAPMRVRLPGRDLPPDTPMQFDEEEFMVPEDYELVIERGYEAFLDAFFPRVGIQQEVALEAREAIARHGVEDGRLWGEKGVCLLVAGKLRLPFDWFSYARSLKGFMMDLFRRGDELIEAMDVALESMLESTKAMMRNSESIGVFIPMARGSATFISPKQFERYCFPWLKRAVDELVADGYVPVLHCDANWTPLLEYFRDLPAQSCILQLDEDTDIFEAKKVLGDHMCLYGNVSSTLLSLGVPEEVEAHCRRLVQVVGDGGGFVLGPACTMPMDAKPENVKAMRRAVFDN